MKKGTIKLLNEYGREIQCFTYSNARERSLIIEAWIGSIAAYVIAPKI
jgi:hypothetical protein